MKTKSPRSALLLILLTSSLLTGCATGSSAPKASLQIYQPRVLQLRAGVPVPTPQGTYVPPVDEIWHSPAAFEELENQLLNATAALSEKRNNP